MSSHHLWTLYSVALLWHLAGNRRKCRSPGERKKGSRLIAPRPHCWSREAVPMPSCCLCSGKREDGARNTVELSWAMQTGGDQGARDALASTTQQSHGWGLAWLVLRTAVLPLLFSITQFKIQSDHISLPIWDLVVSWFGFLETASGTSQTPVEHLDSTILWRKAVFLTEVWPDYTQIR